MNNSNVSLERREALKKAGAVVAAAGSGISLQALAAKEHKHDHSIHKANPKLLKVADTALDCVKTSELCNHHCFEMFKSGDTTLAECADLVQDTIAACTALAALAASHSKRITPFMEVCIQICQDCEKECRMHEKHHAECKECADSCVECIDACKEAIG